MPLQAVFTSEKSTKVRLVIESSSKGLDGLSLNNHLEKGPNYISSLPNVLTAWHWDEYAYSGDIRRMFNQVLVHPDDQFSTDSLGERISINPHRVPVAQIKLWGQASP